MRISLQVGLFAAFGFAACPVSVVAQPPATLRLSEADRADLLAHNSEAGVDAARAGLGGGDASPRIHGEIGAMVGTNGARGIYGTAAIPLGQNAGAVVSFEKSRFGGRR